MSCAPGTVIYEISCLALPHPLRPAHHAGECIIGIIGRRNDGIRRFLSCSAHIAAGCRLHDEHRRQGGGCNEKSGNGDGRGELRAHWRLPRPRPELVAGPVAKQSANAVAAPADSPAVQSGLVLSGRPDGGPLADCLARRVYHRSRRYSTNRITYATAKIAVRTRSLRSTIGQIPPDWPLDFAVRVDGCPVDGRYWRWFFAPLPLIVRPYQAGVAAPVAVPTLQSVFDTLPF